MTHPPAFAPDYVSFAEEELRFKLFPEQAAVLRGWSRSRKRRAVWCLGRRSGKGVMAAIVALHNATVADYSDLLMPGDTREILAVATELDQAARLIRTTKRLIDGAIDDIRMMVDPATTSTYQIGFRNGVVFRAMPCSSRSTRGGAVSLLIMDEAGHMMTTEDGFAAGKQVYQALAPATIQFGNRGLILVTSTPKFATGIFWDLFQRGTTAGELYVAQKSTLEMNPIVPRHEIEEEYAADPDYARSEYGAEFIEGAGAYLPPGQITACMVKGRTELPPVDEVFYVAAADPAFAAGGDAFTFCIGHMVGKGESADVVVDLLKAWRGKKSPLNSDKVLDEIAEHARRYRVRRVISDQYAVVPLKDGLQRRGIKLIPQPLHNELKADIFGSLKKLLNLEQIELLDDPVLRSELVSLQLRATPAGKPHIAAAAGHKDDRAMVVATVAHALVKPGQGRAFTEAWRRMAAARATRVA